VVGIDIQLFDDQVVTNGRLVVIDERGKSLGRPMGRFAFLFPRGSVDRFGRLRLMWAEPADEPLELIQARFWITQRPTSVWSATYDSSAGWSEPQRIEDSSRLLRWPIRGGADTFGTLDDNQAIVIPRIGSASWRDQELVRHELDIPAGAIYPSIVVRDQRVYIAYIAAAIGAAPTRVTERGGRVRSDTNSVFFLMSKDGGTTWLAPRLVSLSGDYPAHGVHVLVGEHGEIHMVWKQALPNGSLIIRHVISDDDGATWGEPSDYSPAGNFEGMRAALDRCGTVHVVYEDWAGDHADTRIVHVSWSAGWTRAVHPFAGLTGMTPDLRADAAGHLSLIFVGRRVNDPTGRFATYMTTLGP
jgi:hypothetical protein